MDKWYKLIFLMLGLCGCGLRNNNWNILPKSNNVQVSHCEKIKAKPFYVNGNRVKL